MKHLTKILPLTLFLLPILFIFRYWFYPIVISSGDWFFYFNTQIKQFIIFPYLWSSLLNNMGGNIAFALGLNTYSFSSIYVLSNYFNFSWVIIERIIWFWPLLIISTLSSYYLAKKILLENKFSILAPFIFLLNTYILMMTGGGQMGVAMAYSLSPLVLSVFIKLIDSFVFPPENIKYQLLNIRYIIIAGLVTSVQLIFDSRILYVTLVAVGIYFLVTEIVSRDFKYFIERAIFIFVPSGIVVFFINAFWLLPFLVIYQNPLQQFGAAYITTGAVKYFSFAKFEDAISLLQPNWPENIFGKVNFMKPEFLLMPILAYSSLLFVKSKIKNQKSKIQVEDQNFTSNLIIEQFSNISILAFVAIGLIGAFLAKGANDPFGGVYLWLFKNVPGFIMFRDPTKWYMLVAISYSVLIPFSMWKIYEWLKSHPKFQIKSKLFNFQNLFLLFVVFYLLFLIRPAWMGQLTGTFKPHALPKDYIKFEKFISQNKNFYRTFWVPAYQRFGFRSDMHPTVSGRDFINKYNPYDVVNYLKDRQAKKTLQQMSVRYVIIPYDSEKELFLKNRKYDNTQYLMTIRILQKIPWLTEVNCSMVKLLNCSRSPFDRIVVFEVPRPKDHLWLEAGRSQESRQELRIMYKEVNPTKYEVQVSNVKKGDVLVFSETYDKYWEALNPNIKYKTSSIKYDRMLNSFVLPKDGTYNLEVYYAPQKWVNIGLVISLASFLILVSGLIVLKVKK